MIGIRLSKVKMVMKEYERLGCQADVCRVTGYSRALVSAVINGNYEIARVKNMENLSNHYNADQILDQGQENMENFGGLQYLVDKMTDEEQVILTEYFVHETPKVRIAKEVKRSVKYITNVIGRLSRLRDKIE